ncbi:MAG TPA: AAA family ATPase [Flavobacterium sp.]|nr:AAA family ATPase [Flavobacterium sp.]
MKALNLKATSFDLFKNTNTRISSMSLYYGYFEEIPNTKEITNVDITASRKWIFSELKNEIIKEHYCQQYVPEKEKNFYFIHFFILKNNIMIHLEHNTIEIVFSSDLEVEAEQLQMLMLFLQKKKKKTTEIRLITRNDSGLTTTEIELKKPKLNLNLHYNDAFKEVHQNILKNIRKENTKGLYLFHGEPGTGKSTYIKHLIHQQTKEVIFLSPKIAGSLENFALTEFLIDRKNCVLVIEDAEELVVSRDNRQNSGLSFLLNLTDGLLGESLGIQIIATFNTDVRNIDKALLRKGRLTAIYEFKKLSVNKTNVLLEKLGKNIQIDTEMSLADIFNLDKETYYEPKIRKAIGFGS